MKKTFEGLVGFSIVETTKLTMIKKLFLFIVAFVMLFSSASVAKTVLLVTLESPPAEYLVNGQPAGRNVEIVQECMKRMGYECRILFVPWKRALIMVQHGAADGIIDAAYNKERAQYLFYPKEVLYVEEWYGFKRKGSDLTLDKDLNNSGDIQLGISRGFEYGGPIQDAINNNRFKTIEPVFNNELNITKLVANRFDMFIGVKLTISYLAQKMGYQDKIERIKMTGTDQDYLLSSSKTYLAFSKKTMTKEIAEEFSNVLAGMKTDGTIKQIEGKYY